MDWSQRINRSLLELSDAHSASRIRTDEYRWRRRELLGEAAVAARRYASESGGRLDMPARRRDCAVRKGARHAGASKTRTVLAVMLCVLLAAVAGGAMFLWLRLA
ncbi:hypothetical protein HBF26_00265 [Luteibacter jiangsuensis]|uniref:Uncharacterized protein n=1 Tax=Luteibacter jiangsuensis TaxID=637577 RepID=A0ABX0PY59_9GAMM|nr:hypothetical protein [Luteibacter jiangsuensis]NID03300.1 hypothetical protein [Luteibacter jiangsuensis]